MSEATPAIASEAIVIVSEATLVIVSEATLVIVSEAQRQRREAQSNDNYPTTRSYPTQTKQRQAAR